MHSSNFLPREATWQVAFEDAEAKPAEHSTVAFPQTEWGRARLERRGRGTASPAVWCRMH